MKLLIRTRYVYKNSIDNICLTLKCDYFTSSGNKLSVNNVGLPLDNVAEVYLLHSNGLKSAIYSDKKTLYLRATMIDVADRSTYDNKVFSRDKYDKIMEALSQYNAPRDSVKMYSEIYNDKKQVTSVELDGERVAAQLLECLYNKYIVKSGYIKQVQYQYNYTDRQKVTFLFEGGYRQVFHNIPTKMGTLDTHNIK